MIDEIEYVYLEQIGKWVIWGFNEYDDMLLYKEEFLLNLKEQKELSG